METKTSEPRLRDELFAVDDRDSGRLEDFLWRQARIVWARKVAVAVFTTLAVVGTLVVVLLTPNEYDAGARVLAPQASANPLTAIVGRNLSSAAASLFGGSAGEYSRYRTILTSRSLREVVLDSFDLIEAYDLQDAPFPREAALQELERRTSYPIDLENEYMSIVVRDRNPERAAQMANFIVAELNRRNAALNSQSASSFRRYVQQRYDENMRALDTLLDASQAFQKQYGLYDITAQTQAFFTQAGIMSAEIARQEIAYAALYAQYGANHPQVEGLASALSAARARYQSALSGSEQTLPVPQASMPTAVRQYLEIERDLTIQRSIAEIVGPMLEQARFQEEQQAEALQLVDPAIPPVRKSYPRRSITLVLVSLSAFVLAILLVLLHAAWKQQAPRIAAKLTGPQPSIR